MRARLLEWMQIAAMTLGLFVGFALSFTWWAVSSLLPSKARWALATGVRLAAPREVTEGDDYPGSITSVGGGQ